MASITWAVWRALRTQARSAQPTRTVYDPEGRVTATWMGTNDVPNDGGGTACWCQWPQFSGGVDLVQISANVYDSGSDQSDALLTTLTKYQDGTTTRVWTYGYDYRDRQTSHFRAC